MNNPFDNSFSPYDALIELNERMNRLEKAHNNLARAFETSEQEYNQLMVSHQQLQKAYLTLNELINLTIQFPIK